MARRAFIESQRIGWQYAKYRARVAFYLQMRLGKSLLAIRWARSRINNPKILIVSPLSVLDSWQEELDQEDCRFVPLIGRTMDHRLDQFFASPRHRWFGTNWEGLVSKGKNRSASASLLTKLRWSCVIADESTRIRNARAQITKTCLNEFDDVKYKAVLSGLPNPEGMDDFVTQMMFVNGSFMGFQSFWDWRLEHMIQTSWGEWIVKHTSRSIIRAAVHESSCFVSRKDVGIENEHCFEKRVVKIPPRVVRAGQRAAKLFEIADQITTNKLTVGTWLAQLAGGRFPHDPKLQHDAKINEVVYLLKNDLAKEPVVIFCRYTAEVNALVQRFQKEKISTVRVIGDDKDQYAERVNRFRFGKVQTIIAQAKCLQMGKDLSRSDTIIFYSNYWENEVRSQCMERIEHPKKRGIMLYIDIIAQGTADEMVVPALAEKRLSSRMFRSNFFDSVISQMRDAA